MGKRVALDLKLDNSKYLVFSLEEGSAFVSKLHLIEALSSELGSQKSHFKTTDYQEINRSKSIQKGGGRL